MNKNLSPIAASFMTFNGLAIIEAAMERDLRVAIYKEENDSSTPESGPFRIKVMPYPLTDNSQGITASGATLAEAMGDLGTATLEMLDGIIPDHNAAQEREEVFAKALENPEGIAALGDQIQQALKGALKPRLGDESGSNHR